MVLEIVIMAEITVTMEEMIFQIMEDKEAKEAKVFRVVLEIKVGKTIIIMDRK